MASVMPWSSSASRRFWSAIGGVSRTACSVVIVEAVLVGHVGGDLRGGEDLDQIEAQLQRNRPVFRVRGASAAQSTGAAPFLVVARPG
jgi:hypothetical protein